MKPAIIIKPDATPAELRETLELCIMEAKDSARRIRDDGHDFGIYDLIDTVADIMDRHADKVFKEDTKQRGE